MPDVPIGIARTSLRVMEPIMTTSIINRIVHMSSNSKINNLTEDILTNRQE